jgi:hypothetical protein
MQHSWALSGCLLLAAPLWAADVPKTEITKWQDGKQACVSLTFDDASINHFRVDIPLLDERGMPGTFFIITNNVVGSKYQPTFVGRPIMEILRESERTPTSKDNWLERTSMLNYLQTIQRVPEVREFKRAVAEPLDPSGELCRVGKNRRRVPRQTTQDWRHLRGDGTSGTRRRSPAIRSPGTSSAATPLRAMRWPTTPSLIRSRLR